MLLLLLLYMLPVEDPGTLTAVVHRSSCCKDCVVEEMRYATGD